MSRSGRGPSAPAHAQRGRGSSGSSGSEEPAAERSWVSDSGGATGDLSGRSLASEAGSQGIGATSTSVLHMYGSAAGVYALKTARNTSPDTVLVPVEPTRVTLTSRPDTPRSP